MNTRLKALPMLLCLSVVLASSIFVTQQVAADNDTEMVTFTEPVMVGGTLLEADTYRLVWTETGTQVQVNIMKDTKTVATVPATLVIGRSNYHGAIQTRTLGDNSRVLEKITWKKKALVFEASS